jgi:hypothetical protein
MRNQGDAAYSDCRQSQGAAAETTQVLQLKWAEYYIWIEMQSRTLEMDLRRRWWAPGMRIGIVYENGRRCGCESWYGAGGERAPSSGLSGTRERAGPEPASARRGPRRARGAFWRVLAVRRERGEREALGELGLPREPAHRLGGVDPLAPALLALEPLGVERGDGELEEVVRARGRRDRRHEARDRAADAGCGWARMRARGGRASGGGGGERAGRKQRAARRSGRARAGRRRRGVTFFPRFPRRGRL